MSVLQSLVANRGKLYAIHKGEPNDDRICFTTWDGRHPWSPEGMIGGNTSSGPSATVFQGEIYAAWKGEWSDPRMFFNRLSATTWIPQQQMPDCYSDHGPALGVIGNHMVAAWKSVFDQTLWYATYNGLIWSAPRQIPGVASSIGPSMAEYRGKLYAAWKGENSDTGIYCAYFDGTIWSPQLQVPAAMSSIGPSLTEFENKLYAFWKGVDPDERIYYASFNGTHWSATGEIPHAHSSIGAAVCEFDGRLYAMWKGGVSDTDLHHASFDGMHWAHHGAEIPGKTGPDPVGPAVTPPAAGLGSNSNYILYGNGSELTDVTATILITEDMVSTNGFGFQLNSYCPSPQGDSCAWQQYCIAVTGNAISGVINNWPVDWDVNGTYVDLILEWITLQPLGANLLKAGYQLTIQLQTDAMNNIVGCTFIVMDDNGVTQANVTKTLMGFGYPGFTSADLAPINAFELDIVGPDGGQSAMLTSGQGLMALSASTGLIALNAEPAGDLPIGTAETANTYYSELPATYPNGEFWQAFSTNPIGPTIIKPGTHMLRRPSVMAGTRR